MVFLMDFISYGFVFFDPSFDFTHNSFAFGLQEGLKSRKKNI